MVVSRHVLKPKQDKGAGGAAMLFSVSGCILGCLPLSVLGWVMGPKGSFARILGIVGTVIWSLAVIAVTMGAFGFGDPPPEEQPPPPPAQFFDEDTPKKPEKK